MTPRLRILLAILAVLVGSLAVVAGAYWIWSPGLRVTDGRNDLGRNGIWIQHGWLGDDTWFDKYKKDKTRFRNDSSVDALAKTLADHRILYVYPHLCPTAPSGEIPEVDVVQARRFLVRFRDFKVLPWVGGVLGRHCRIGSAEWRANFCRSAAKLLAAHPEFAGLHLNIEPLPSGNREFLKLLEELRAVMPAGKLISVAAYLPPTVWHQFPDVHWEREYYAEVGKRCDQVVAMMYDTSIPFPKVYQNLMKDWTREVVEWPAPCEVLLGLPAYEDEGVGYHDPKVENLMNSLGGIHAGLSKYQSLPANYAGVAIYSEWVVSPEEWKTLEGNFLGNSRRGD